MIVEQILVFVFVLRLLLLVLLHLESLELPDQVVHLQTVAPFLLLLLVQGVQNRLNDLRHRFLALPILVFGITHYLVIFNCIVLSYSCNAHVEVCPVVALL